MEREDGIYYEAEVNDPLELLPLLRSYAPCCGYCRVRTLWIKGYGRICC